MLKLVVVCSLVVCGVVALGVDFKLISKGQWIVERTEPCPNSEDYTSYFDLRKRKVNRTHDGFFGEFFLADDLTDEVGIYAESCKKVDGGCRINIIMEDKNICNYLQKYAERNWKNLLNKIGVDEKCPVPKGSYNLNDFVFDYAELPEQAIIGSFKTVVNVKKANMETMFCRTLHALFDEHDDRSD